MSQNKVTDPITDQEMAFAHLVLSGTLTDHRAAELAGLNPETAAYTKAKPCVHEYIIAHRVDLGRERVLARLWEIADMDPERTRNSMSAQIKAISMIVAIENLIPNRRAATNQNKPASPVVRPAPDEDKPGVAADAPSVPVVHPVVQPARTIEKKPDTLRLRL